MTRSIDPEMHAAKPAIIEAAHKSGGTLRFLIADTHQYRAFETTMQLYARRPLRVLLPPGNGYAPLIDTTRFTRKDAQEQDGIVYQVFQNF